MDTNNAIVLIHGAGFNSSIWDNLLNEISYPALCIHFPNRNTDGSLNDTLTFDDYLHDAIQQIEKWEKRGFIVVAYSIGALTGLKVANHFKDDLKGFVAIGSIIPKNGNSFVSSLPFPQKLLMPLILKLFGTKPPKNSIEKELCNDLSSEQTLKVLNNFTPEAKALYLTKIQFDLPDCKRLYTKLNNDQSIPVKLQDAMAKNLDSNNIITLDSGHLPMLSKPEKLANILIEFANEIRIEP